MNITELFARRIRIALSFIFAGSCCSSAAQAFLLLQARALTQALVAFGCSLLALVGLILIWTTRTRPKTRPDGTLPDGTVPGAEQSAGGPPRL